MSDIEFGYLADAGDCADISCCQAMTRSDVQTVLCGQPRSFSQAAQFMISPGGAFAVNAGRAERCLCIGRCAQLNLLRVHLARCFDLFWIRIDEKTRHDAGLAQLIHRSEEHTSELQSR